ncbi:MAG: hypothetical protein WEB09_04615 [Nitriliruptor sp.]
MPAVAPLARIAMKYGPVAKKAADTLKPQVQAYLLAQQNDGYIVDWHASGGHYYFVLDAEQRRIVDSFPHEAPQLHEAVLAGAPSKRIHYRDHWIHKAKRTAMRAGELPSRAVRKVRHPRGG